MKRIILAVLLYCFFCTINGVASARELKYYLICNEAYKTRAKAKLKDAKACIILSKAGKAELMLNFEHK